MARSLEERKILLFVNKKKQKNFIHRQPHDPAAFSLAVLLRVSVSVCFLAFRAPHPTRATTASITLHTASGSAKPGRCPAPACTQPGSPCMVRSEYVRCQSPLATNYKVNYIH